MWPGCVVSDDGDSRMAALSKFRWMNFTGYERWKLLIPPAGFPCHPTPLGPGKSETGKIRTGTAFSLSSEFCRIFLESNFFDLLAGELLWGHAGRIAGVPKKTVQASRRHNPQ